MTTTPLRLRGPMTRRSFVVAGGAVALAACASDGDSAERATVPPASDADPSTTTAASVVTESTAVTGTTAATVETAAPAGLAALTAADFDAVATCTLLPEMTTGPFPLEEQFDRRDITEGHPGHPLRLGLRVVDATCSPLPGAAVEVWHADATGDYSAFTDNGGGKDEGAGSTFLRGTQVAGDDGIVEFHTIYPGWYRGRAVHIHLRVWIEGRAVLASQLFFDDDYTLGVHADTPYAEFGPPDTTNAADGIAGDVATNGTLASTARGDTSAGPGTQALLNLGVPA